MLHTSCSVATFCQAFTALNGFKAEGEQAIMSAQESTAGSLMAGSTRRDTGGGVFTGSGMECNFDMWCPASPSVVEGGAESSDSWPPSGDTVTAGKAMGERIHVNWGVLALKERETCMSIQNVLSLMGANPQRLCGLGEEDLTSSSVAQSRANANIQAVHARITENVKKACGGQKTIDTALWVMMKARDAVVEELEKAGRGTCLCASGVSQLASRCGITDDGPGVPGPSAFECAAAECHRRCLRQCKPRRFSRGLGPTDTTTKHCESYPDSG